MGEMPIYPEERSSAPQMRVTINDLRWWKAVCMIKGHMWWKCLVHAYDMCEVRNEDGKGDGKGYCGMPTRSQLTHVDGQGGELSNDEICFEDLEELWQRVVDHGKEDVVEEYNGGNLWRVSSSEKEVEAINGDRGGLAHILHDD